MSISTEDLKRLVNEQAKRIAELEAALKPFAEMKATVTDNPDAFIYSFTCDDIRQARKALDNK